MGEKSGLLGRNFPLVEKVGVLREKGRAVRRKCSSILREKRGILVEHMSCLEKKSGICGAHALFL